MSNDYWKLLQSPKWQKKRLEKLNESNWECENCGAKNIQLHVHHKQYFKGLDPWEYQNKQLEVLCDFCHKEMHEVAKCMKEILSYSTQYEILSLIVGYVDEEIIYDLKLTEMEVFSFQHRAIGVLAGLLNFVHPKKYYEIANLIISHADKNKEEAEQCFRQKYDSDWDYL